MANEQLVQLELNFGSKSDTTHINFSDPAFASNKVLPIHRWIPWIAGFSRDFVASSLDQCLKQDGTVLDPFAGVGTTLVEAYLRGNNVVGFEINPYAYLASKLKLSAPNIQIEFLRSEIQRFTDFYRNALESGKTPLSIPPQGFRSRIPFYSPNVLHKVLIIHDFIKTIEHENIQLAFRLAFASTMVTYSNYSYEPSLATRASSGKEEIEYSNVGDIVITKLTDIADDLDWLRLNYNISKLDTSRLINASFFDYKKYIPSSSVDLIITSPPYLNNYHYNRNTRPHLYWLGYAQKPSDLQHLEEANFGKFWQTVRDLKTISLNFQLENSELVDKLTQLRNTNTEKGVYGGNGWANYAASYFNDCYQFALGIKDLLKPNGNAVVVIGNSILQGIMIPTDKYFAQIAQSVGLELKAIHIPRDTRVGSSIIQSGVRAEKAQSNDRLYEAVVELRRKI